MYKIKFICLKKHFAIITHKLLIMKQCDTTMCIKLSNLHIICISLCIEKMTKPEFTVVKLSHKCLLLTKLSLTNKLGFENTCTTV